jgi:hypothetical protein
VRIATTILSLEILASSFAGWSAIYPDSGIDGPGDSQAKCAEPGYALMEFNQYPRKYISSAAIAKFPPPESRQPGEAELYRMSKPELAG